MRNSSNQLPCKLRWSDMLLELQSWIRLMWKRYLAHMAQTERTGIRSWITYNDSLLMNYLRLSLLYKLLWWMSMLLWIIILSKSWRRLFLCYGTCNLRQGKPLNLLQHQLENHFKQHKLTWVGETQERETQYFYPTIEHNTDYFKSFTLNGVRHLVGGGSGGGSGDDGKYLRHYTLSNSINEIGLGVCGYNMKAPLPWSIANADVISFKNESEGKNF